MNIFLLDYDQELCAHYHCDKHAVKMIVEYAQLLSTAHRLLDGELKVVEYTTPLLGKKRTKKVYELPDRREPLLYKATHANHPSAVWARASLRNYQWLVSLLDNLCHEYTRRYGRIHKVQASGLLKAFDKPPQAIFKLPIESTPFALAMPDEFKRDDPVEAYRAFYLGSKIKFAKWTNRQVPPFVSKVYADTTPFERTR